MEARLGQEGGEERKDIDRGHAVPVEVDDGQARAVARGLRHRLLWVGRQRADAPLPEVLLLRGRQQSMVRVRKTKQAWRRHVSL